MPAQRLTFGTTHALIDAHTALCWAFGMLGCEEISDRQVRAFFAIETDVEPLRRRLLDAGASSVEVTMVADEDWNATWRESIQPVRLTPDTWVSPSWRAPALGTGDRWIKIEPKMAFGTGHHESTRLAAWGIERVCREGGRTGALLDIGTGSGVLCLAASLLGFDYCAGFEIDLDCRENLAENRRENSATRTTGFVIGTTDCIRRDARFDVVVMNMIFNESAPLLGAVRERLAPGGRVVWSGILREGRQEAVDAASRIGLQLVDETSENEWWSGIFEIAD